MESSVDQVGIDTDSEELASEASRFEKNFRRERPVLWWGTLVGPLAAPLVLVILITMRRGWDYTTQLLGTAVFSFFVFGRFIIILGGETEENGNGFFSPETLVAMVMTMDLITASLIAFHAGFLWRLPVVGSRLQALVKQGQAMIATNPTIKRATFLSITAFVMFPLASTGSIGGSLFGRLLGMSRIQTFLAVLLGSLLGCGVMYFGASLINRYVDRSNPLVTVAGIACTIALIYVLSRRFRQMTRT